MASEVKVLDKGFVRLDAYMADDLSVVNSARVSFNKRSDYELVQIGDACYCEDSTKVCDCFEYERRLKSADAGLIKFLMKHRHGTPFEHNAFRWHIKAPISVFREWQRHRIASYNEMSARYVEMKNEFYVPAFEDLRTQVGKPGAYTYESLPVDQAKQAQQDLVWAYSYSWQQYQALLTRGVAKEVARQVLPVGIYSEMYWTTNARSMMNFLSLRNAPNAMLEIRRYAEVIEDIWSGIMPSTAMAFIDNNRIAP